MMKADRVVTRPIMIHCPPLLLLVRMRCTTRIAFRTDIPTTKLKSSSLSSLPPTRLKMLKIGCARKIDDVMIYDEEQRHPR